MVFAKQTSGICYFSRPKVMNISTSCCTWFYWFQWPYRHIIYRKTRKWNWNMNNNKATLRFSSIFCLTTPPKAIPESCYKSSIITWNTCSQRKPKRYLTNSKPTYFKTGYGENVCWIGMCLDCNIRKMTKIKSWSTDFKLECIYNMHGPLEDMLCFDWNVDLQINLSYIFIAVLFMRQIPFVMLFLVHTFRQQNRTWYFWLEKKEGTILRWNGLLSSIVCIAHQV